ncbi:transcriptional regulator with XRE-family HTH domain [Salirhabdus euzebyi]|uniref:Transcriptional regulator with XRE-family HTH domain n=1 Tax=Salirhabdus euzebyi TaxID=394506 RepID=A0A841Q6S2_9BACI|nr:helix-turn-helix domain-containing protein [Salirhabdus euzebyi]MBB6454106.1 transcriptional regulator with XRE-family HTH domain [Salirhabdus euzebyi]
MLISGNIGEKIKDLREYYGISQKSLCDGICSQAYISRLEKGEINVSADILFLLSRRFGIDINFFFENYNSPRSEYITLTINSIRDAIKKRDYNHVEQIVSLEMKNALFTNNLEGKQFLLWNKGICSYHLGKGRDKALEYINEALACSITTTKNYSEREIEILLSKAIILLETERYYESKTIFEELLYALTKNVHISDVKINVRSYYNYVRLLIKIGQYKEAIENGEQGIYIAQKNDLIYLQGEIYFQIGRCYSYLEDNINALEFFKKASYCFDLNREEKLYNLALTRIDEIHNKAIPEL